MKSLGQETRNLEIDLNEALNQAASSRQVLKHLEPDVQAIQGRKDLEAKIIDYSQCKHFRVRGVETIERQIERNRLGIRRESAGT